ncbi:MAG: nitroreductase family protein [Candidatus Altiarchaeales archaeon]|nr:nitroreductase family protein [Candidatus Altiarchaeales archaeon]
MDVLSAIKQRRSIREFRENASVCGKDVNTLINAARWAPSARNLQPLEYVIVKDDETRGGIAEAARQPQPREVPVCLVVLGDLKRAGLVGQVSPHEVTTSDKGRRMFLYMDAAAAIENMLLTAEYLGFNSLWISSFDEERVCELVQAPKRFTPLAIICVGKKTDKTVSPPPKRPKEDIVHYGGWSAKKPDESYIGFSKKINPPS